MKVEEVSTSKNLMEYQINLRLIDSVLRMEKVDDKIKITIKRKYFGYLPDMAVNYRIMNNLVIHLPPIVNKV